MFQIGQGFEAWQLVQSHTQRCLRGSCLKHKAACAGSNGLGFAQQLLKVHSAHIGAAGLHGAQCCCVGCMVLQHNIGAFSCKKIKLLGNVQGQVAELKRGLVAHSHPHGQGLPVCVACPCHCCRQQNCGAYTRRQQSAAPYQGGCVGRGGLIMAHCSMVPEPALLCTMVCA